VSAAGKVYGGQYQRFVHGQYAAAVPFYAPLFAQSIRKGPAQGDADVFHAVVVVNIRVPFASDLQPDPAVDREQRQHVVKKTNPRIYIRLIRSVQVQFQFDIGLTGLSCYF
jgi:hypothetical protein